ncbi:MAG TPA: GntR family transcriptional regulator, partial [Chloroflexota bacterium]|nr:GntR family transcriptional regulator [Chloroflexota bacterium]
GLVEFKTGQGPFVSAPTVDEVLELYDCRLMYEAHAIREGTERVDDAFLHSMQQAIRQHELLFSESDGTYESRRKVLEADKDFHLLILSLWCNQKATAMYRQMNVHIRSFQLAYIPDYRRETSIGEHHEIYAGLEKRDAETAAASVRHHIVASKEGFLKRVRMAGLA